MEQIPAPTEPESSDGALALARAKIPEALVAGPYGHPLHPALVAVPIGAWVTAFTFDLRSLLGARKTSDARSSRDAIAVGLAGGIVAAAIGVLDWRRLTPRTKAYVYGSTHAILNLIVIAFYARAWLRRGTIVASAADGTESAGVSPRDLFAHAGALGVLSLSGIIGGELSYRFGVRVADEATQREGHVSTR